MSMEAEAGTFMGIECAVTGPDGKLGFSLNDMLIGRYTDHTMDSYVHHALLYSKRKSGPIRQ